MQRRRKPSTPSLRIGDNLAAFEQILEETQPEKEEAREEEQINYTLNEQIHVEQAAFDLAIKGLIANLLAENKMNLASAIKEGRSELFHNRWSLRVANHLEEQIVAKDKGLMPYLREQLGVGELFLALSIEEQPKQSKDLRSLGIEDKLRIMTEENPALKRLQEIFKTRIIY